MNFKIFIYLVFDRKYNMTEICSIRSTYSVIKEKGMIDFETKN